MSLLEIIWVTLVIVIIAIILVTDPKTSNIGINNNIITSNLEQIEKEIDDLNDN